MAFEEIGTIKMQHNDPDPLCVMKETILNECYTNLEIKSSTLLQNHT